MRHFKLLNLNISELLFLLSHDSLPYFLHLPFEEVSNLCILLLKYIGIMEICVYKHEINLFLY